MGTDRLLILSLACHVCGDDRKGLYGTQRDSLFGKEFSQTTNHAVTHNESRVIYQQPVSDHNTYFLEIS